MFPFEGDQIREQEIHRELRGVPAVDAREKRLSHALEGFLAEAPADERGDGLFGFGPPRRNEGLPQHPKLASKAEETRPEKGQETRRHRQPKAFGKGMEAPPVKDIDPPAVGIGGDELGAEPELLAESAGVGLRSEKRVRSSVHEKTVAREGGDEPPEPLLLLQYENLEAASPEVVGDGETRDPTADDENFSQDRGCWCTRSTRSWTFSTGVPGRIPWPRLKTWPGRPAACRRTRSTRSRRTSFGAKSARGSRFPWPAASSPPSSQPRSRSMRQSRPMPSPPASRISRRIPDVPVPK